MPIHSQSFPHSCLIIPNHSQSFPIIPLHSQSFPVTLSHPIIPNHSKVSQCIPIHPKSSQSFWMPMFLLTGLCIQIRRRTLAKPCTAPGTHTWSFPRLACSRQTHFYSDGAAATSASRSIPQIYEGHSPETRSIWKVFGRASHGNDRLVVK